MDLPQSMKAMVLESPRTPLFSKEIPLPVISEKQVLVKIRACGVCRTDLHVADGELPSPKLPLIPGHEIIGEVVRTGKEVLNLKTGELVGIPWLGYTCGKCRYCLRGQENLCENALFTGYTLDGGYAQYTAAYESYCFPLPASFQDLSMAPLLCAGLIGFRSYNMLPSSAQNIGFYGFGAAAHILIQVANYQHKKIYAFTRENDKEAQALALKLGAVWTGSSSAKPPLQLDAAIIFAPAGDLIPKALRDIDKGGSAICAGIHMSDIPSFPYHILWGERSIRSVANLTRKDAGEFLRVIADFKVHTTTQFFPLCDANQALNNLREGKVNGAAVLVMD